MNTIGISVLSVLIFIVLVLPRRWAVVGMAAGVLYLTQMQQIEVSGINMYAFRFLELAGIIRVLLRRELSVLRINQIDRVLGILYIYTTLVFLIRSKEGHGKAIGDLVDALLCYFTFRVLIRDAQEFRWFLRAFVFLLVPYVLLLRIERVTGNNPFNVMGVIGDLAIRDGEPRCVGSFRHPSLLGTLGASFLPLYIGLCFERNARWLAWLGIALCGGVVLLSNSGGPLGAMAAGLMGWGLWKVRTKMRMVRWGIVSFILLGALLMNAPVWYLISKLSGLTGGDGWHRAYLLDMSYQNLGKWALVGMPLEQTAEWFPYQARSTQAADITNAFIDFGIRSGLPALIFMVLLLVRGFQCVGMALARVRDGHANDPDLEPLLWGLGTMLAVHVVNWFGICYWDQIYVIWFFQLAALSTLAQNCWEANPNPRADTAEISGM